MRKPRDLDNCARCGHLVPVSVFGRGEWLYPPNGAELGPYCSVECLEKIKENQHR